MRVSKKKQKGFTLVELLVVVAIIAVLAAILLPRFLGYTDNAREARAMKDVRNFVTVIDAFAAMGGNYPEPSLDIDNPRSIASVMQSKGIKWTGDENGVVDPWKNPYYYDLTDDYYCVASPGKDGVLNTSDDICSIGKVCKTASGLDENAIPSAKPIVVEGNGGNEIIADNEEDFIFDPETGSITGYVGEGGDVVIPDTIGGVSVSSIGRNAFRRCNSLTSVRIPDSVTTIGSYAFDGCSGLTEVTIPDSVTTIGSNAFRRCNSLTSVRIPDSVTTIGSYAFDGCSGLTEVTIPDSVTTIGSNAFNGCSSLTEVAIPSSVVKIGYQAFYNCSSLSNVNFEGYVDNITFDSAVFRRTNITEFTFKPGTTKIPKNMFNGCDSLASITIPNSVINIGTQAFKGCSNLNSLSLPENIANIGRECFCGTNLTSITIPDSIVNIERLAFNDAGLENIIFEGYVDDIVFGDMVFKDNNITSFAFKPGTTRIPNNIFYGCTSLVSVIIPESVTYIGDYAFSDCVNLGNDSVIFEGNIEDITFRGDIFRNTNITEFVFEPGISKIPACMFFGCNSLTNVVIPESVTSIGLSAFNGCSSLISINIPNSVTVINDFAFIYCSGLTSVDIPSSVTKINDRAFYGCTSLTSITIPNPNTVIYDSKDTIAAQAVIIGHDPSTAKTYAEKYSRTFETL